MKMKSRTGFVSNSSSSSFVIIGNPDEELEGLLERYAHVEIKDADTKKRICERINGELNPHTYSWQKEKQPIMDHSQRMILTRYVSDCGDEYGEFGNHPQVYYYFEGGHGGPYWEDDFEELKSDVWIHKEDNNESKIGFRIE